jgi:hypothetical protein
MPIDRWNREVSGGVGLFDRGWGESVAPAPGGVVLVVGGTPARLLSIDSAGGPAGIPVDGVVIIVDTAVYRRHRDTFVLGATMSWRVRVLPELPASAAGGFPILITDSALAGDLDVAGGASFAPVRHPRTAVAIAGEGRRLLLVTVDGRQPGWSVGMTLRELADLLLRLGATDALNLDGGGSTAMVVSRRGRLHLVNRTSDTTGERPVANALALVRRCG